MDVMRTEAVEAVEAAAGDQQCLCLPKDLAQVYPTALGLTNTHYPTNPWNLLLLSLSLSLSLIAHSYNQTKTFGSPPPPHSHPPHECIVLRVLPHTKTVSGAGGGGGPHKPYYRSFTLQMAKGRARARVRVEGLTVYVMSGWLVRSLPFP